MHLKSAQPIHCASFLSFWYLYFCLTKLCDLCQAESLGTNATSSIVADDTTEDLEFDMDKAEQASRTNSIPVSTANETSEFHDHDFQERRLPLGTSISSDDQVSSTDVSLETEKVLVASSDAAFDDSDDHAVESVEIFPGKISAQAQLCSQYLFTVYFSLGKISAQSYHVQETRFNCLSLTSSNKRVLPVSRRFFCLSLFFIDSIGGDLVHC